MRKLILLSLSLILSSFQSDEFTATVISIEDGDSITVLYNDKPTPVRLYGIDCPEDGQALSTKAKQFTTAFSLHKKVKIIKRGVDLNNGDRIVGDVILEGNKSLSKELIAAGLAWHYKKYSNEADFAQAEEEAKTKKKGLWAEENPVAPWDYRKTKVKN